MRASSVVKRQFTRTASRLRLFCHVSTSPRRVSLSGMRRSRHCRASTPISVRVVLVDQSLYHMCPVHLRATLLDLDSTPPFQGREQHEQTAHSIALVFVVVDRHRAGRCGTRHSRLLDQLFARLIHAHQNLIPIIRPLVDLQHVFHRAHKVRALTGRDAPTLLQPRFEFVFFNTLRTVSVLMVSTISHSTNWSANSFRVQTARPSGGSPQAIAINLASPSPSSLF